MIRISSKAVAKLKEQLICKCFEVGIGFRLLVNAEESSKAIFSIKLDRQHPGDEVIDSDGVRLFGDPSSATQINDYQLDYHDELGGGFFLNVREKASRISRNKRL